MKFKRKMKRQGSPRHWDGRCPKCAFKMNVKTGSYGQKLWTCENCGFTKPKEENGGRK